MKIHDQSRIPSLYNPVRTRDGRTIPIPSEHLMEIWVNDRLTMKVTCTGQYLPELVLGRLLTEDIIGAAEEVEEIRICEAGVTARVYLLPGRPESGQGTGRPDKEPEEVPVTPTCCTGNRILDHFFSGGRPLRRLPPLIWDPDRIRILAEDAEREDMFPLYAATHAVHACSLMADDRIAFRCEDIGRHNALDKAIGYALRSGLDLRGAVLFTTGRVPTDMALKVIRGGVPVLAARKVPTAEAVELAEQYGLTILQAGRCGDLRQFTYG